MSTPPPPAPHGAVVAEPSAPIALADDGRIRGIDGMLDQVASAAMRQARVELWPAWQADRAMQRTVGEAVGRGAAATLAPWVALGATSLAVGAAALVFRAWRDRGRGAKQTDNERARSNPASRTNPPRKRPRRHR